jgi:transposase
VLGEKSREIKIFYYLRPEDLIPSDHILRLIHEHIDFSFIRSKVEHLYSYTGRPSIDPEVMMRMLLVGYLFGMSRSGGCVTKCRCTLGTAGLWD